jgi:hypothetical protein
VLTGLELELIGRSPRGANPLKRYSVAVMSWPVLMLYAPTPKWSSACYSELEIDVPFPVQRLAIRVLGSPGCSEMSCMAITLAKHSMRMANGCIRNEAQSSPLIDEEEVSSEIRDITEVIASLWAGTLRESYPDGRTIL